MMPFRKTHRAAFGGILAVLAGAAAPLGIGSQRPATSARVDSDRHGSRKSASYTKKGPGRKHRHGFRGPRVLQKNAIGDAQIRFRRGYMNRGERERYVVARAALKAAA